MLFGVWFAVQLSRAEARGDRFVVRYLRRLAVLAVFGFIVVVDILFTPHGFGWSVSPLMVFGSAVLLFAAQVVLSRWWLTRFRSGPLEWAWRSITYWKAQPLRLASRAAAPLVASA